jgi:hypothetical protein
MQEITPDPRVALLTEQDRRLLMVGQGTMGMMLAAAEKAGLIPKATAITEYGIASAGDPSTVVLLASLEGAVSHVRELRETTPDHDYRAVSRVHTHYEDTFTEWTPVPMPEENHA